VTNPLSVKTKVHVPRSPSALLSTEERSKVFLEVHIQNLTSDPMWFERIVFEPAPVWHVQDANLLPESQKSLFSGAMAIMQPQDTRQFIYILNEINPPAVPVQHAPGEVLPLGRLDISWRSSFGEPGRLLTSVSLVLVLLTGYSLLIINDRCYPVGYLFQTSRPPAHLSNPLLPSRFTSSGLPP
jgi:trafficking protein particle complex subunit 13